MAANRFLQLMLIEELENDNIQSTRIVRRTLRDMQDPFRIPDAEFIYNFRLNKEAAMYIINTLNAQLNDGRRNSFIPKHIRVLATLHFLAVGSYQRSVGNSYLCNMSQPMISRCLREVSNVLLRTCSRNWIQFPKNNYQFEEVKNRFQVHHHINHIIGIVDGTHVAIVKPSNDENEHVYVNRKGYHSLNVQIICDARLRILSCYARYPGSTHDSFIWRNSTVGRMLKANFQNDDHESRILGDSGYPCLPWLLVPISRPRNDNEVRFNNTVKRVRSTVERCIGVLKGRFRCLLKHRTLHYTPRNAARIVMVCAVLHNIALHHNVPNPEPMWDQIDLEPEHIVDNPQEDVMWRQKGQQSRQRYIEQYFLKYVRFLLPPRRPARERTNGTRVYKLRF